MRYLYEQSMHKTTFHTNWKAKRKPKFKGKEKRAARPQSGKMNVMLTGEL